MDTIKFPISFDKGSIALLSDGSNEMYSQIIAILCQTERGEFLLEPTYGVADSTFDTFHKSDIFRLLSIYWPEISVNNILISEPDNNGRRRVTIDFGN